MSIKGSAANNDQVPYIDAGVCGAVRTGNGCSTDNRNEISRAKTTKEPVKPTTPFHPEALQKSPPVDPATLDPT
jgi:hypothetical protein